MEFVNTPNAFNYYLLPNLPYSIDFDLFLSGESDGMSSDFSEICACGQVCVDEATLKATTLPAVDHTGREDVKQEDSNDFTDIIVLSDLHEKLSTTEGEVATFEDRTKVFNGTTRGFTVGSSEDTSTNPEATDSLPATETPTTSPSAPPSDIHPARDPKHLLNLSTASVPLNPGNSQAALDGQPNPLPTSQSNLTRQTPFHRVQDNPFYKRAKHIDIIPGNITQTIFSTLLPSDILHKLHTNQNHIVITNLSDSNAELIEKNGKHINKELKVLSGVERRISVERAAADVGETAELAKDSGELLLHGEDQLPVDILKGGPAYTHQAASPPGWAPVHSSSHIDRPHL